VLLTEGFFGSTRVRVVRKGRKKDSRGLMVIVVLYRCSNG
jgi:hypothetical protein